MSANGERAPLLGAQLEGGENAFPSLSVVDLDLTTTVSQGRAALVDATIVDVPTVDERGERPAARICPSLQPSFRLPIHLASGMKSNPVAFLKPMI